jgi:hypothetical protein
MPAFTRAAPLAGKAKHGRSVHIAALWERERLIPGLSSAYVSLWRLMEAYGSLN